MIRRTLLDNGIRVLSEKVPGCHSVSLGLWVNSGSRHETDEYSGISHFLEHMLFKGTQRRSAKTISREVDSVGGVLNGFTGRENSCYYIKVLTERLPLAVDLLGDMLCHSLFDLDDIEKERRVIFQEISMIEDSPEELIHERFVAGFWSDHPLGRSVLGTRQSVEEIDREALVNFLRCRYVAENLVVVAAGGLEHDDLVELVSRTFGDVRSGPAQPQVSVPTVMRHVGVTRRELEQTHLCLGVAGLPSAHVDRYGIALLNVLLGGNMSSRLFQKVREDLGLAYSVYSYLNSHSDSGALTIYAGTAPPDAARAVRTILAQLSRLRREPVPLDELQGAKDYLKGSMLLSLESTDNRMTRLAQNELLHGDAFLDIATSMARIDAVTIDLIQSLSEVLFVDETLNLQVLGRCRSTDFPEVDLTIG